MNRWNAFKGAKKGSERDILLIVTICLFIGIMALIVTKFMAMFNQQIQAQTNVPDIAKVVSSTMNDRLPKWFDGAFIMLYIFLMIVALVLALMVDTSPIMVPISLLYMVFIVFISYIASNIWTKLIADTNIAAQATALPIMSFMMPRLHIFSLVIGMGILVLMVSKRD